ncbi:MAG: RNB domain-containing ribonuclease [Actinomycetota bacterium]|nr:RNB domain-containing ribonuclease [Actinomycetota bacterium]
MPRRSVNLQSVNLQSHETEQFTEGMLAISAELDIDEEFPPEVIAEADQAAASPKLPDRDRTDIDLVTIDPPGAQDLDQALHIERHSGRGFRVHYAIADVAAFVEPGGSIDLEAHRRGQTLYAPDRRIPLHPPNLSEDAASLLPDQTRPALLWTMDLDERGEQVDVNVERALVRSRGQFDYATVQQQIDEGSAGHVFALLKEVGQLRLEREIERGGVSLPLPEQEVVVNDDRWSLEFRQLHPVEEWNAQISLLTGMGAAEIMLYGEVGVIRTLPPADHRAVARLRRTATALGLAWPADVRYPDFVRSIDPNSPAGAAMLNACTALLRGAAYVAFEGGVPEHIDHAAIAHEYSHVTAPLRRLVDRYAGEVAVALSADTEVPDWVRAALKALPREMAESTKRAQRFERAVVDLVEAGVLAARVGQIFTGVIIEVDEQDPDRGSIMLQDPPVEAAVRATGGSLPLGQSVQARLVEADKSKRKVHFELA